VVKRQTQVPERRSGLNLITATTQKQNNAKNDSVADHTWPYQRLHNTQQASKHRAAVLQ